MLAFAHVVDTKCLCSRACPGRHLADQNVWAAIVTMLATLQFEKARDEFGNEIQVKTEFTSGIAT